MKEGLALLVFGEDMEFLPFSYSAFPFTNRPKTLLMKGRNKKLLWASSEMISATKE